MEEEEEEEQQQRWLRLAKHPHQHAAVRRVQTK
jgi:hypothetical protein